MKIVAIIPARGGSKRIPGKNVKLFAGLPMIAHSIRAARDAGVFDRVVVSTDSQEIAQTALSFGAEVPFMRPPELSDDFTGTDPVVIHSLQELIHDGYVPGYFCCIYPTAPFLRPEFLREGLELLRATNAETAFSVTSFPYPIFRALKVNSAGRVEMLWPENFSTRSQDLPEAFHDAGQFYWGCVERYLRGKRLFSADAIPVRLPRHLVQDIDTLEDWETAEKMYRAMNTTRNEETN